MKPARERVKIVALATAMATALSLYEPAPAVAQNFGAFLGGMAGAMLGAAMGPRGRRPPSRRAYVARPSRGSRSAERAPRDDDAKPDKSRDSRTLAMLSVPSKTQTAVFKGITSAALVGAVGSDDDKNQVGQTSSREGSRDYTAMIGRLIETFKTEEARGRASGEGDITEHAILQAVDDAYKRAHLERFGTFVGENWTLDNMRVLILDRVTRESSALLRGTNKGRVSMTDLRGVIDQSADAIYQRLFETSELLAANRGSTQFSQLLYQAQGQAAVNVRDAAERALMKAAAAVNGDFDALIRRDKLAYALAYRKKRIIFDCLADHVPQVSSGMSEMATAAEIEQRIDSVAASECKEWVERQFLQTNKQLAQQDPVPLRVVWSKSGPVDDPSMYTRPTGGL